MSKLARMIPLVALVATALMAAPSGASGATTIGQTVSPGNCIASPTRLQTTSPGNLYAAPSDGVITQWSFQAGSAAPQLKFKVGRPAGGNLYTIIGESGLVTPAVNILNNFSIQITVQAGDLIGFYVNVAGQCGITGIPGFVHSAAAGDITPPNQATFNPLPAQMVQLDVSARLEPDCDKDGLGDETQDTNIASCQTPAAIAALTCRGQQATIIGTPGNDVRSGTPGPDVMAGLEGNDTLTGLGGNDVICGAKGNDALNGGPGNDQLLGQKGNDKLLGKQGKDKLSGKKGKDTLKGAGGKDTLKGGGGNDVCIGGKANDTASKCEVEKSI